MVFLLFIFHILIMRKILFWILIIVFLFLVVVLWVAFYNDKTPLNVLKWWFGVEQSVYVKDTLSNSSEEEKKVDVTEKMKETVEDEGWATGQVSATGDSSSGLSQQDRDATKALVDQLIVH